MRHETISPPSFFSTGWISNAWSTGRNWPLVSGALGLSRNPGPPAFATVMKPSVSDARAKSRRMSIIFLRGAIENPVEIRLVSVLYLDRNDLGKFVGMQP